MALGEPSPRHVATYAQNMKKAKNRVLGDDVVGSSSDFGETEIVSRLPDLPWNAGRICDAGCGI